VVDWGEALQGKAGSSLIGAEKVITLLLMHKTRFQEKRSKESVTVTKGKKGGIICLQHVGGGACCRGKGLLPWEFRLVSGRNKALQKEGDCW